MLSILIPVYNYDIRPLVKSLHQQAQTIDGEVEIICMDDASRQSYRDLNKELSALSNIRYVELTENIGRAAIRNRLAELASFDYCLFMDCDVMPEDEQFLENYRQALTPGTVICGGRSYVPKMDPESPFYLHWFYGSNREVKTAAERELNPYNSFMTNNFVIPRSIILEIPFDESIRQYGHEDTVFGLILQEKKIPIIHLDNPLRHIGLDETSAFIRKTEQAVENLLTLSQSHHFGQAVKLFNYYLKTKRWGLHPLLKIWFKINKKRLLKNLKSKQPNLRKLDLYKLGYMLSVE